MPLYGMSFIGRLIILFIGTDDQHILSYNPGIFYFMTNLIFLAKTVDKWKRWMITVHNSVDIVDNLLLYEVLAY